MIGKRGARSIVHEQLDYSSCQPAVQRCGLCGIHLFLFRRIRPGDSRYRGNNRLRPADPLRVPPGRISAVPREKSKNYRSVLNPECERSKNMGMGPKIVIWLSCAPKRWPAKKLCLSKRPCAAVNNSVRLSRTVRIKKIPGLSRTGDPAGPGR